MKVFLICKPCDDSYYDGSPYRPYNADDKSYGDAIAFASEEEAKAYCRRINGPDDGSDPHYHEFALYVTSVTVG